MANPRSTVFRWRIQGEMVNHLKTVGQRMRRVEKEKEGEGVSF
jgi:hypothetical protein